MESVRKASILSVDWPDAWRAAIRAIAIAIAGLFISSVFVLSKTVCPGIHNAVRQSCLMDGPVYRHKDKPFSGSAGKNIPGI